MIGTDYGHHDPSSELSAIHLLRNDKRIAPLAVNKILETNPRGTFMASIDARDKYPAPNAPSGLSV